MVMVAVLLSFTTISAIEDDKIEFTIHKRMYSDPDANPDYTSSSGLLELIEEGTYGFNGVEFSVFELSEYFAQESLNYETIAKEIADMPVEELLLLANSKGQLIDTITTTTVGGEPGIASITVNPLDYAEENQVFLFVETKTPNIDGKYEVIHKATPMLIVLPVEHPEIKDEYLSQIHLYPKNFGYVVDEEPEKPVIPEPPVNPELPATGISTKIPVLATTTLGLGLVLLAINKYTKIEKNEEERNV